MSDWKDEWIARWIREGLAAEDWPLDELPIVHDSERWLVRVLHRRTACENTIQDSKIWVKAPPGTVVRIEYEYGKGQAFDHPNILGTVDDQGYLWWYNAARTPGRMSVEVDGEPLVERVRFDLSNEYCGVGLGRWNAKNRPGQYVYDLEFEERAGYEK